MNPNILGLYPSLSQQRIKQVQPALCPHSISLPKSLKKTIEDVTLDFIAAKKKISALEWRDSVLNSLDFHYSQDQLKVIEANTNASGFLISHLLETDPKQVLNYEESLFSSFASIFQNSSPQPLFIIDAQPEAEKMYAEFLMFKDFFKRQGLEVDICKSSELPISKKTTYVYNRDTDFFLEKLPEISKAWKEGLVQLSTSPTSYKNIADKTELHLLREQSPLLEKCILKTLFLTAENRDEIWSQRKKYFFKPTSSFGSKGVYSGRSISKKRFLELPEGYMAQELQAPGKLELEGESWKFDLRAFFSESGVQKILARVYQGQLTNFSNLGGGFALIDWL